MPEIYSGDTAANSDSATFTLTAENVGGEDATNVHAKLFGLGTDWSGADWTTVANRVKSIPGTLDRANPQQSLPGGSGDVQWAVTAPVGLKVDNSYTAGVRLYYTYKTTALANVKVYNNNYLKTNPSLSDSVLKSSGIDSFTVTSAPITVTLAGLARPLVYKGSGSQTAAVTIMINNVGTGFPFMVDENDMFVHVDSIMINNARCTNDVSGTNQKLPRNGAKAISCSFSVPNIDSFEVVPLDVQVSYSYFLDGSTSVKVLKSMTAGSSSGSSNSVAPTIPAP
jgi:hypothetical protein